MVGSDGRRVAEKLFQSVSFHFHSRDRRLELGGKVSDNVVCRVVAQRDPELASVNFDIETLGAEAWRKLRNVVVQLENQALRLLGKTRDGSGVVEAAGVDRDEIVAHAF